MSTVVDAFEREAQLQRARWQLRLRWVAIGLVLLALISVSVLFPGVVPVWRLVATLAVLAACNLAIELLILPRLEGGDGSLTPEFLIRIQIAVDLLIYTLFLHWSGGAENPAAFYYVLQVIIAAVLLAGHWAYVCAAAASVLYTLVLLLEYLGVVSHVNLAGVVDPEFYRRPMLLALTWGVLVSAVFLAAYLATAIVHRLKQRERELSQSNLSCEVRSGELAAANRRLREMAEARATFLRYVTHELRAPVAAIQSYLRLMREGYIPQERVPEIATRAEQRAEEVLMLIADLLDLGQVEHADVAEGRERLNPRDALMDAVDLLRPSAVEKRIRMDVRLDPATPIVFANPRHLSLLWNNLISNAIKYTPSDGKVAVSLSADADHLTVAVADTGIGISPEDQARVFEEFYRSDAAKRFAPHGTGIGLAIVQRVVRLYGGTISIESRRGEGSTFTVRLPLRSLQAATSAAAVEPPPDSRPALPRTLV
ncbi:MAG: sensor histidine kinase [Anaerolineae bacterium]